MYDFEIAFFLYKMAKIHDVFFDSKYKARAYYAAAMALDAYDTYVMKMYGMGKLKEIPYIGNKIESCIIEIIETGSLKELIEYEKKFQIEDYTLLLSWGLSNSLIRKIWDMSIHSAEELLQMQAFKPFKDIVRGSELIKLNNFTQEYTRIHGRYLWAYGERLGKELIEFLKGIDGVRTVEFCGDMTAISEKIRLIEIEFSYDGNWEYLRGRVKEFNRIWDVQEAPFKEISGRTNFGIPFRLLYKENVRKEHLVEKKDNVIINLKSVYGDLHTHTRWTDGIHSLEEMIQAAENRGYEYVAITDHSNSMHVAHGLSESQALSQIQKIKELEKNYHVKILSGIEVDILYNGDLDYSDEILREFDFVVAAIHSHMNQPASVMKERLSKALANPYVNILAHPTGRLLGRPGVLFSERAAYEISVLEIIEICKKYNVVLEVNCFPERFDLNAADAMIATKRGVKLSLGTDAHSQAHLRNIEYGVELLASIGIKGDSVLNTYHYNDLVDFFEKQKPRNAATYNINITKNKKDFRHYFGNNLDILQGKKRIIGIDLTGSEDKESGWAYLTGEYAECKRIGTDAELIETVENLKPDIISIDSPLAYPKGRCCSRKDCECSKYGIMRKSERLLRHFNITVYPCLIDSMVNVTTRGMRLAKILREKGYTVIESYPGVAQDVLLIPRKGKTQEQFIHLKQGLISFGIIGDLITNPSISHDEVDAITSALVGYFYLNNQYIGLGNDDEDYLIVPRIQDELLQKRIIIGLSGETGAGKTTIAEYLRFKYGFEYFRYSKIIEEKYQIQDKKELQEIGALIAQEENEQRELTKYMINKMDSTKGYVIDGLRHYEDYDELRKCFGDSFVFLYIDCRYKMRCARYQKLNFYKVTSDEFKDINGHIAEKDIGFLGMYADYRVDNNKGFKDLWNQIEDVIKKENGGKK